MKTLTTISVYGLETSKNFESKIARQINDHLNSYDLESVKEIYISDAGMRRASGYGQYKEYVSITIDGVDVELKSHSTDAPDFDFFNNNENMNRTYSNRMKGLIYDVIEKNLELIDETLLKEREAQENA